MVMKVFRNCSVTQKCPPKLQKTQQTPKGFGACVCVCARVCKRGLKRRPYPEMGEEIKRRLTV
jgi:hypothetical protein